MEQKTGANQFTMALGEGVDSAFKNWHQKYLKMARYPPGRKVLSHLHVLLLLNVTSAHVFIKNKPLKQELHRKKLWKPPLLLVWCLWVLDLTQPAHF